MDTRKAIESVQDIILLQNALKGLDQRAEYASYCEKLYSENPFSTVAEDRFNKAYEAEYAAFIQAANIISQMIGCDLKVAREMVRRKRTEIDHILGQAMSALNKRR